MKNISKIMFGMVGVLVYLVAFTTTANAAQDNSSFVKNMKLDNSSIQQYVDKAGGKDKVVALFEELKNIKNSASQKAKFDKLSTTDKQALIAASIPTVTAKSDVGNKISEISDLSRATANSTGCRVGAGAKIQKNSMLGAMYVHQITADICWKSGVITKFENRKSKFTPIDNAFFSTTLLYRSRYWGPSGKDDFLKYYKNKKSIDFGTSEIYKLCWFNHGCIPVGVAKLNVNASGADGKTVGTEKEL